MKMSRRAALAAAATMAAPTAAHTTTLAPDTDLLAACDEYHRARCGLREWEAKACRFSGGTPEALADEEEGAGFIDQLVAALNRAVVLPATTPDGVRAKSSVLRHTLAEDMDGNEIDKDDRRIKLALSLCDDLQRVLGGGA